MGKASLLFISYLWISCFFEHTGSHAFVSPFTHMATTYTYFFKF